jgi:predicted NBD/HSP70 family sugar kinase
MNYIYLFNPSCFVFGGKITEYEYFDISLLKSLSLKLARKPVSSFEHVKLLKAKLGNNAALMGVASLAK